MHFPEITISNKGIAIRLEKTLKLLAAVDEILMPKSEIAKTFNMTKSNFFKIIKNRDLVLRADEIGVPAFRRRSPKRRFHQLDKTLNKWLKFMRSKKI